MKRIIYFITILMLPVVAKAQPTITQMENFTPPYKVNRVYCDSNVAPGSAGPNQHWMFTNLMPEDTSGEWIMPASYTPHSATFTAANEVRITADSVFSFYNKTTAGTELVGVYTDVFTQYYTPSLPSAKRPLNYNDNVQLSYGQATQTGGPQTGEGDIEMTADAYGMLHLPNGVYNDVIRVKTVIHQIDTLATTPILITSELNALVYQWYNNSYKGALLEWDSTFVDYGLGTQVAKNVSYLLNEGDPASVVSIGAGKAIYATASFNGNSLHLDADLEEGHNYLITMFSLNGQKIYSQSFNGKRSAFDISTSVSAGMYMIVLQDRSTHGFATIKAVKQ